MFRCLIQEKNSETSRQYFGILIARFLLFFIKPLVQTHASLRLSLFKCSGSGLFFILAYPFLLECVSLPICNTSERYHAKTGSISQTSRATSLDGYGVLSGFSLLFLSRCEIPHKVSSKRCQGIHCALGTCYRWSYGGSTVSDPDFICPCTASCEDPPGDRASALSKAFLETPIVSHILLWMCQGLAFAWIIGFLSFLTPGDLGIREGLLGLLLANYIPIQQATLAALLCRVWGCQPRGFWRVLPFLCRDIPQY